MMQGEASRPALGRLATVAVGCLLLAGCGAALPTGEARIELTDAPQVFEVNADGTGLHRLSSGAGFQSEPSWSPDSKRLVVDTSQSGGGHGLAVIDEARRVRALAGARGGSGTHPKWSPDGMHIAFVDPAADEVHSTIRTIRPDGTRLHTIAARSLSLVDAAGLEFSPDGGRIAFAAEHGPPISLPTRPQAVPPGAPAPPPGPQRGGQIEVIVVDVDGHHPVRLGDPGRDEFDPVWSPDGRRLLVLSRSTGPPPGEQSDLRLEVIDVARASRQIIDRGRFITLSAAWLPDGQTLALSGVTVDGDRRSHLYLMNPDGTGLRQVDDRETATLVRPEWSPDGRQIAFAGFESLAVFDLAHGSVRNLVEASRLQIDSLAWSPDGSRIAFTASLRHVGD